MTDEQDQTEVPGIADRLLLLAAELDWDWPQVARRCQWQESEGRVRISDIDELENYSWQELKENAADFGLTVAKLESLVVLLEVTTKTP